FAAVEVGDEPGAVEDAVAEIARQAGKPAPAEHAAQVAHRILAVDAGPVRERRAGDEDRPEDIRAHAGGHHRVPAGLTGAGDARLAGRLRMELAHLLDEDGVRTRHILDTLALHRLRGEADKVDRMSELERIADLADRLEAADARPLTGARVDDD